MHTPALYQNGYTLPYAGDAISRNDDLSTASWSTEALNTLYMYMCDSKSLRSATNISLYVGDSTRYEHGKYGRLIGSHM